MSKSGTTWSFEYDASGLRTKRTNGTTAYEYFYTGDKLTYYPEYYSTGSALKMVHCRLKSLPPASTWGQGRMLTGVAQDSGNYATYQYDSNGLRRAKQVCTSGQTITTEHIWGNNGLAGLAIDSG